jgi:hypothetical protein
MSNRFLASDVNDFQDNRAVLGSAETLEAVIFYIDGLIAHESILDPQKNVVTVGLVGRMLANVTGEYEGRGFTVLVLQNTADAVVVNILWRPQ